MAPSKFYSWQERYGRVNEHNAWIPRDFWLEPWEKRAILDFQAQFPLEGYRRLTFMMLDRNVVAVSPASVWQVLHHAGRLSRWNTRPSQKGRGFHAPVAPHEHWHVDVSYLKIGRREDAKHQLAEAGRLQAEARDKQEERISGKLPPPEAPAQ